MRRRTLRGVRRSRAAQAAGQRRDAFRTMVELTPDIVARFDRELRHLYVNPAIEAVTGLPASAFVGRTHADLGMTGPVVDRWRDALRRVFETGEPANLEFEFDAPDGTRCFHSRLVPERDASGRVAAVLSVARDVTEQRRAQEVRLRLTALVDSTMEALHQRTVELCERVKEADCLYAISDLLHRSRAPLGEVFQALVDRMPGGWQRPAQTVARLTLGARRWTTAGFRETPWRQSAAIGGDAEGGLLEVFCLEAGDGEDPFLREEAMLLDSIARHVTETLRRRAAEERLERSEALFRALIENAGDLIALVDGAGTVKYLSPSAERLLGHGPVELLGSDGFELVHPEDRPRVLAALLAVGSRPGEPQRVECRVRRSDGTWRHFEAVARRPPDTTTAGGILVNARDVTARIHAEEERRSLEAQLRQSQKMEALGRLAGGVAHDFNNLLTVIKGGCSLLLDELDAGDPRREDAVEIDRAADRAAALTRQLLAFGRRQVVQPVVLCLDEALADVDRLLRRLIGEDVELVADLRSQAHVRVDRGQIEQVVVNLAVNARDAMPRGGRLTIATRDVTRCLCAGRHPEGVEPARLVELAVTDTGVGMSEAVRERVFEPFFTTKEGGTGLGLATVYGIIRQAGGDIGVQSTPGAGTTFRIYMRAVPAEEAPASRAAPIGAPAGGSETILLVEDEAPLRALARRVLERAGYRVIEAAGGPEALRLMANPDANVHLLVSDVVMPRMSGPELARALLARRPGLRVLLMSGYTDNAFDRHGVLGADVVLLEKPFSPALLARTVREVLDGAAALPARIA